MEIVNIAIKDLVPNKKNPRKITKREMNNLIRSIKEFGFVDPVIVNKNKTRYNVIIGGHQRVEAAKKMKGKLVTRIKELKELVETSKEEYKAEAISFLEGMKNLNEGIVPVTYVDMNEEREQLLNIALNEISGEWDDDKLLELLKELEERGIDLTLTGFDEPILDEILSRNRQTEKEALIDVIPKTPEKAKSQLGEVWKLGAECTCPDCGSKL